MKIHKFQTLIDDYHVTIEIHTDEEMGPPWEEHDGHGDVTDWVTRDKQPGELTLATDGIYKRFYNLKGAMVKAKEERWGLSDDDKERLTKRLGRRPTAKEVRAESVQQDFNYCKGYADGRWQWLGYVMRIASPDGASVEGAQDSCWGYDDEGYMIQEAKDTAAWTIKTHRLQTEIEKVEAQAMACRDIQTL